LAVLTNAEYIAAEAHFESLQLSFPSHNTFASQITSIGPLMNTLLRFVIYFVNPAWKKVGNKSDEYIDFQWWRVIRGFYFPLPPVQDDLFGAVEGAISVEEYTARKARAEAKSKRFPLDLRAHLVTNKALWLKATKVCRFALSQAQSGEPILALAASNHLTGISQRGRRIPRAPHGRQKCS
jgi:hypothetical protein